MEEHWAEGKGDVVGEMDWVEIAVVVVVKLIVDKIVDIIVLAGSVVVTT